MGIRVNGDITVDLPELMNWKDGVVKKLTGGVATLLKGNKVEVIKGEAYFSGPGHGPHRHGEGQPNLSVQGLHHRHRFPARRASQPAL